MKASRKLVAALLVLALAAAFPAAVYGQVQPICNDQVTVQATTGTSAVAVTGVAGTTTYICGAVVSGTVAGTFSVIEGTGTTCGTATLGIIGDGTLLHTSQAGVALSLGNSLYRTTVLGNDVCLKSGVGATITLTLSYIRRQ